MRGTPRIVIRTLSALAFVLGAPVLAAAASDATLLRLFLTDGTALVSYGEFARLDDRVVFSMPVGGTGEEPRLHVVTIPARAVDWSRTDRYVASARYQHYASTRAEEDFSRLSSDVARVLNEVALTTEPHRALQIAEGARKTLADWPRAHYGYRQREVREILGLLDEAISDLRAAAGVGAFDLTLVAMAEEVPLEPLLGMPAATEMVGQILAVARLAERSPERVALLQSALALVHEAGAAIPNSSGLRASLMRQIREELATDEQYARLAERWLPLAARASANARIADIEKILARIGREDRRLGHKRPDVIQALNTSLRAHLHDARQLRLLRDQWLMRRAIYRRYQDSVSTQLLQLVKAQPALQAIKGLEGPPPRELTTLRARLDGGAAQLKLLKIPEEARGAHDMLIGAWQFAESAVRSRHEAIASGDMPTAWQASSSAAGALMMLERVQAELRSLLEPPTLR